MRLRFRLFHSRDLLLAVFGAFALAAWPTLAGAEERAFHEGVHEGADFIISMPSAWNGGLLMYAHGYQGEGPAPGTPRAPSIDFHLTESGYAWAASGYRSGGFRPDWFLADTIALRERFIREFGRPRWTIVYGQSMGGHVVVASLELHPEVYQGGLAECGNIDGVGYIDWIYAYTAAAEYFSEIALLDASAPEFSSLVSGKWSALMGTPDNYTERGRRFDSVVKHLAGGDVPLRIEGLKLNYFTNLYARDPGRARPQELARHADTRNIQYAIDPGYGVDAEMLNRNIRRIMPAPGARSRDVNPVFAELTGKIVVPLMTIHETGDFRVPFRLEQDYRRRTQAAGASHLLVQRAVRSTAHCGTDAKVRERAFDDLVAWMERGAAPRGDDVLGDAAKLGLEWTPVLSPGDPARRP